MTSCEEATQCISQGFTRTLIGYFIAVGFSEDVVKKLHYLCVKLDIHDDNEILHEGMVEKIAIKTPCA